VLACPAAPRRPVPASPGRREGPAFSADGRRIWWKWVSPSQGPPSLAKAAAVSSNAGMTTHTFIRSSWSRENTRTPEYHTSRNGILDSSRKDAISGKQLGICCGAHGVSGVIPSPALLYCPGPKYAGRPRRIRERPKKPREEAVQGAGMWGPILVQGAAESDASAHLGVRSHVPGTRRDRAQAEEAGIGKAKPHRRLVPKESAYGPSSKRVRPMTRFRRTPERDARSLGSGSCGQDVRRVYPLDPPSCSGILGTPCFYGPELSMASPDSPQTPPK
jgi:hypothetical protein